MVLLKIMHYNTQVEV